MASLAEETANTSHKRHWGGGEDLELLFHNGLLRELNDLVDGVTELFANLEKKFCMATENFNVALDVQESPKRLQR